MFDIYLEAIDHPSYTLETDTAKRSDILKLAASANLAKITGERDVIEDASAKLWERHAIALQSV